MGAASGPCQCPGQKEAIVDLTVPAYNSGAQTNGGTGDTPVATSGQPPAPGWNCCCSDNTGPEKGTGDGTQQQFDNPNKRGLDYVVPPMASPYSADMKTGSLAPDTYDDMPPPPGQFREDTANDETPSESRGEDGERTAGDWADDQAQFAGMPPLPEGWIRVRSRTTESIYYCYTETGETTFTEPTGPPESVAHARRESGQVEDNDLPPGWTAVVSRSSGQTYFWHAGLQKSQFTRPTAADSVADDDDAMQHKQSGTIPDDGDLPPGWLKMVSRSTGKTYFFHMETQTSQFERPT